MPDNERFITMPIGYKCPNCGNEISLEESLFGDAIFCNRCPNGEYTGMEPIWPTNPQCCMCENEASEEHNGKWYCEECI